MLNSLLFIFFSQKKELSTYLRASKLQINERSRVFQSLEKNTYLRQKIREKLTKNLVMQHPLELME